MNRERMDLASSRSQLLLWVVLDHARVPQLLSLRRSGSSAFALTGRGIAVVADDHSYEVDLAQDML